MKTTINETKQTTLLVEDPARWACRYSSRPTIATPLFIQHRPGGEARLLDIAGGVDPDWTPLDQLGLEPEFGLPIDPAIWHQTQVLIEAGAHTQAFDHLVHQVAQQNDEWSEFEETVSHDRYFASAWFERDRSNVVLTDTLSGKDLVALWDDDVTGAIESGYLRAPRHPRPREEDWLQPLVSYAQDMGLIHKPEEVWDRHQLLLQQRAQNRTRAETSVQT